MLHNDHLTFGEILRQLRKKAHLTQQQLAAALGMHRHAINRWEQGEVLPGSRAIVLEMIRLLHLNDQEARALLEASFTGPAPLWGVPFARNPFFTGRTALMETLQASLQALQKIGGNHAFALQGLGGIGKTQLALEYAYRFALSYHAIFWIEAETQERVMFSLQRIAELLRLPEENATNQQRLIQAVQGWLNTHEQWLMIWDNLEEVELASQLFPRGWQGTFLLTTRQQSLGTLAQGINLGPMEQEEAALFLLRRAKKLAPATTDHLLPQAQTLEAFPEAIHLVDLLGGLPLAIDQAGAYIEETGCGLDDYLQHYAQQSTILLDRRGTPSSEHPHAVTTTFRLSFARVERERQEAAELLRASAFLHPEGIPEELFSLPGSPLGATLASLSSHPTRLDLALATLRSLSLIERHAETHTLSLHRLVQLVLREDIEPAESEQWHQHIIHALNIVWPQETIATWAQCEERYLSHVLACLPWIRAKEDAGLEAGTLLLKAGVYLTKRGRLGEAEPVAELASAQIKHHTHPDDPKRIPFLMLQAELAWRQARYSHAEQLLFEILEIERQHPDHKQPVPGETLSNLGLLYWEQGKYTLAEPLFLQVLALLEEVLGPNHIEVAKILNNLAILYWKQGKYALAEAAYHRTLHIKEEVLDPLSPDLALSLSNLATLYNAQERDEEAIALFERALHIQEQVLGPDHPDLGNTLVGLAFVYSKTARDGEAEQLLLRTLHIREQALGPDHPAVAHTLNGLGKLYTSLGRDLEAEQALQRALRIREQALGPDHPDFAMSLVRLAMLHAQQGKDEQAQKLFQQAMQIQERVLDPMHLHLALSLQELADLAVKQGRDEQAQELYRRALTIHLQHQGAAHRETRRILDALSQLSARVGDKQREEREGDASPE